MKKQPKQRFLSPAQTRTLDQQCALNRDNLNGRKGWIFLDGAQVYIAQQTAGEPAKAIVTLPRADFEKFARWYFKPQKIRPSKATRS